MKAVVWAGAGALCVQGLLGCGGAERPSEGRSGKVASALGEDLVTYQVVSGRGVAEAEHFSEAQQGTSEPIHAWTQQSSPFSGAAGAGYMQALPDIGSPGSKTSPPALLYQFEVPADGTGSYRAYVRGIGPNIGGDSAYGTIVTSGGASLAPTDYLPFGGNWTWASTADVTLGAGRYAVRVNMREDGAAIDKVVLQQSGLAAPTAEGPPESPTVTSAQPFVVWSTTTGFAKPSILVQAVDSAGTAFDWDSARALALDSTDPRAPLRDAALYLQEGIRKMTGQPGGWTITTTPADVTGPVIMLVTLTQAPQEIQQDPRALAALTNTGGTNYGVETHEAYYILTQANRTIIVANRLEGLVVAVPELLESVGYEVIGMGPNWIDVPDRASGLTFNLEKHGRPGFFTRNLLANVQGMGGQGALSYKHVITYGMPVPQAPDELVQTSYLRWLVGRRMRTEAAADLNTGAQPISYHGAVLDYMRAHFAAGSSIPGLLAKTTLGPDAARPPAEPGNYGDVWLNSDNSNNYKSTTSNGIPAWVQFDTKVPYTSLDVSQPWVRDILLNALIAKADTNCFASRPDDECVVMVEPEDGVGYRSIALAQSPQWFASYRAAEGLPLAASGYRLHGFKGLNHPGETWDPLSPSDFVYGLDNWLLREYDKRVGSQTTATGKLKKQLIRLTHYSYNYWDVPANFNSDDRIRVAIAGYSKNRRKGQWSILSSYKDVFDAFELAFPSSFQSYRWTYSLDTSASKTMGGIVGGSAMANARQLRDYAVSGNCRALFWGEADLNFGKYGLLYYLLTRVMLTPEMTDADILAAVDHWHERAYGLGSPAMKAYHDLVLNGVPIAARGAQLWAEAMRKIDDAYAVSGLDPASRQRLDDLKTHWYHYHFVDTDQRNASVVPFREFVWKGQMAYQAYLRQDVFAINSANPLLDGGARIVPYLAANYGGSTFGNGRAHYTQDEVNGPGGWWPSLRMTWPWVDVVRFADPEVDLDDLVQVAEFGTAPAAWPFSHNSANPNPGPIVRATASGEEIGLRIAWAQREGWSNLQPKEVFWGLRYYDPTTKQWDPLVDVEINSAFSQQVAVENAPDPNGISLRNVIEIKYTAPAPGIYQFDLGATGDSAQFVDLNWNVAANPFNSGAGAYRGPFTFDEVIPAFTAGDWWFYIPKGTTTLDFQYSTDGTRNVTIYKRSGSGFVVSRGPLPLVDAGVKRIALTPDEVAVGCLASFTKAPAPYFYSIPTLWAKSQSQLMVPRKIAERDGLTILP